MVSFANCAPVRARRIRALEAAIAMEVLPDVIDTVHQLVSEPDQHVRALAARALGYFDSATTRRALRQALLDTNPAVRKEAELALRRILAASKARVRLSSPEPTTLVPVEQSPA